MAPNETDEDDLIDDVHDNGTPNDPDPVAETPAPPAVPAAAPKDERVYETKAHALLAEVIETKNKTDGGYHLTISDETMADIHEALKE